MHPEQFLQERTEGWQELERLLAIVQDRPEQLNEDEIYALGRLYRQATSDLAIAQRDFPHHRISYYLNHLVGRAHPLLYRSDPLRWRRLRTFYLSEFPQLYRVVLPYTTFSFAIFAITALVAFLVVSRTPDTIYIFAGPQIAPLVQQVEEGELWTDIAPTIRSAASAAILTNNIRVTFLTFAGGVTAGVLSAWIIFTNGIHLGAIFGLLQAHNLSFGLAQFVFAHGFVELSVIFVAGGCGLYMGDAILRPGLRSRRRALIEHTRTSVLLVLGCAPLLILAGIIEGFISPSAIHWLFKLAVGLTTGLALHIYWLFAGQTEAINRSHRHRSPIHRSPQADRLLPTL